MDRLYEAVKQIRNEDLTTGILISVGLEPVNMPDLHYIGNGFHPYDFAGSPKDDPGEAIIGLHSAAELDNDVKTVEKIQNAAHSALRLCVQNLDDFVKQEHFKRKFEELIMLLDSLNVIDSRDDLQKLVGSHKVPYLTDRISYTIRMLNYAAKKAHP